MAKRKHKTVFKVDSEEVQGEGSFVIVRRMTWDDAEYLFSEENTETDQRAIAAEFLPKLIVDWDWVDDNDNPLPKPKEDPSVIKRLPLAELNFLLRAVEVITPDGPKN